MTAARTPPAGSSTSRRARPAPWECTARGSPASGWNAARVGRRGTCPRPMVPSREWPGPGSRRPRRGSELPEATPGLRPGPGPGQSTGRMIVALDSSTLTLSLAVGRPGEAQPLAAERLGPPAKMSDLLPAALLELLRRGGLSLDEVRGFAVGLGPGSFTGLRIGLATVKGLAYGRRLGVAGASSLAALALEAPEDVPLAVVAVARRGELYLGRYRRTGDRVEALAPEEACTEAELARWLSGEPEARVIGPAVHDARPALVSAGVPEEAPVSY